MKKILLTFADSRMNRALQRVHSQANAMRVYDFIILANEFNLEIKFREKFEKLLSPEVRGYGYWIWKAQIILQTLEQMDEGDLMHYMDAGCHLNECGRERLLEYFKIVNNSNIGILGFQATPPDFHRPDVVLPDLSEYKWCKGDLLDHLNVRNSEHIINSQSIGAGVILIKKCEHSVRIIKEWLNVSTTNIGLINDSPSISKNHDNFVEHRHDQSIFSLLCKLNNVETVSAYEYWYPMQRVNLLPDWRILKKYPIHAKRDKGEYWLIKPYIYLQRVIRRIEFELKKRSRT